MSSNKFYTELTYRAFTGKPAIHIKCRDCDAVTTYKHDSKEAAWAEHNKRGHSKETCLMFQRDIAMEKNEMSKEDAEFMNNYVNDYHNGNETLEFQ